MKKDENLKYQVIWDLIIGLNDNIKKVFIVEKNDNASPKKAILEIIKSFIIMKNQIET